MSSPADAIYNLFQSSESQFPIPAPYYTLSVGTFDAAAGTFKGLTTSVVFNPEPLEHLANQKPINPAAKFQGAVNIAVSINAQWKETVTTTPAPKVPLAPVLLQFAIINASSPWSVTAAGTTISGPATQTTLTVGVWDAASVTWRLQCRSASHSDRLMFQRPVGISDFGVGAFTIPVVPVSIVYAPPADSLNKSVATYTQGQTIGTTVDNSFAADSSQTVPDGSAQYVGPQVFSAGLSAISTALTLAKVGSAAAEAATFASGAAILGIVSEQFGKYSATSTSGITDLTDTQMTVTQTITDTVSTLANAGGPGSGDVISFYKNVRMVWSLLSGQFQLIPLDFTVVSFSAAGMVKNLTTLGISAANAQLLLDLDPFVAGGPEVDLPADRFTYHETVEYGFGTTLPTTVTTTRDTKTTTTQKSYTTNTEDWEPGPIFQLLGLGGKDSVTTTVSNATGTDVSSVITLSANLVSGPTDHFVVNVWYDNLFGTFAFQQSTPSATPLLQGSGATPGQVVTLTAGTKIFRTVADQTGKYAFSAPTIPAGSAMLSMGTQAPKSVQIGPSVIKPVIKPVIIKPVVSPKP